MPETPIKEKYNILRTCFENSKKYSSKLKSKKVANTKPSHPLTDYVGQYEDPAYGILSISLAGEELNFDFHNIKLPLTHYHYDRFDTPDDQIYGKYAVNFLTDPQGEIAKAIISMDEGEVVFIKKPDASLSSPATLKQYEGSYELAGDIIEIKLKDENNLIVISRGQPDYSLVPYKSHKFKVKEFSDVNIEFILDGNDVKKMKFVTPGGAYEYIRK